MDETYPQDEPERIEFWQSEIARAKKHFLPYFNVSKQLIALFENQATSWREEAAESNYNTEEGRIKANLIFAFIDQLTSNLLDRNPVFSVNPNSKISVDGAPVVKSVVNYWYQNTDQFWQDRRCLQDALLTIWGVKKLGWSTRFEEEEITSENLADKIIDNPADENYFFLEAEPTRVQAEQKHIDHIEEHMLLINDPQVPNELKEAIIWPHIKKHEKFRQAGLSPEGNSSVKYDAPFGIRWKFDEFLIDPDATDGKTDARWIAFLVKKPLYEVKARFPEAAVKDLQAGNVREDYEDQKGDHAIVEYWEIYAKDFPITRTTRVNKMLYIAEGHDKILQEEDEWPFETLDDYPVEILSFQHGVNTWYNYPSLALAGANNIQRLSNEMLDSMLSIVRKQKNLWMYDPEYITEMDMQNILALPEGSTFPVEGLADVGKNAVVPLPFISVPGDKNQLWGLVQQLFDRTNGTPAPVRNDTSDTATEASIVEKRNTAREDSKMNIFKDFQIRTATQFWKLHAEFKPQRDFLIDPRTGLWVAVTDDIIRGEYRFRVDISSRSVSKSVERNDLLNIFNLLTGVTPTFVSLGIQPPNLVEVLRLVLERGYDIQDVEKYLPGVQNSMVEEAMQDPVARQGLIDNLMAFRGGGGAVEGQGPGPVNPQMMAQNPNTVQKQTNEAERLG